MANLDLHFEAKRRSKRQSQGRGGVGKWSPRRTIGFALFVSFALWLVIFWIAKTFLV